MNTVSDINAIDAKKIFHLPQVVMTIDGKAFRLPQVEASIDSKAFRLPQVVMTIVSKAFRLPQVVMTYDHQQEISIYLNLYNNQNLNHPFIN